MKLAPRHGGIEQKFAKFCENIEKFDDILIIGAKVCKFLQIQLHNHVHFEKRCKMRLLSLS